MLFGMMGLIAIFVQGGMIRVLVKRFGEKKLFLIGNFIMIAGLALIPFAGNVSALTLYLCLMGLGASLNGPTLTSLISKEADPSKMGSVLGSSQGLSALGRVIGPTWGGFLFSIAMPVPFLATAAVLVPTLWIGFKLNK